MKKLSFLFLLGLFFIACNDDMTSSKVEEDNFDRASMLANWADNIIIPAYGAYTNTLSTLTQAKDNFLADQSEANFNSLREEYLEAYIAWQKVAMFEIGKAEQLSLRDYTNTFPTNKTSIEESLSNSNYNLELPSTRAQQGFPALDYLLYGSADNDVQILNRFQSEASIKAYLGDIVNRLQSLSNEVLEDWKNGYRNTFVSNDGSEASSSVNKFANDFLFYYEKALRAGKVGIPAGVFSNSPLSDRVEAFYNKALSKVLLENALDAVINFFNGTHFGSSSSGDSFASYLDFLNSISGGESLAAAINAQFQEARTSITGLNDNFYEQVETDNVSFLRVYDNLQANVPLLKVDMFQALNVKVDFVDADGD